MADRSNDIPAPADAPSVVHARYHEVQIARREAEISQLRLQLAEAEYKDQLRQQQIGTIQNEKDALQDKNDVLQEESSVLQKENNALQDGNWAIHNEVTALQREIAALRSHKIEDAREMFERLPSI
ncbi:hypothetical protein FSARC_5751 [Fusarium sarcochroum]|uniref:Uncharacterized protein n=1 Tax=Fusarium sarcochroum TaxID=1208366 RepID=A0A8H4X981_9HYPO|nr:hypothetical protein FSARC_5751 [Fusarium sarcochroum]